MSLLLQLLFLLNMPVFPGENHWKFPPQVFPGQMPIVLCNQIDYCVTLMHCICYVHCDGVTGLNLVAHWGRN